MPSSFKSFSLCLCLAISSVSFGMQRTELLPAGTQTHVRISNTVEFWKMLKKSSISKLWVDQQFQDFIGNPDTETWEELFFQGETTAENKIFIEQMKALTGEVILAFDLKTRNPFIIAAMSKADFNRGLELDDKLRDVTDNPFEVIRSTFQDIEIIEHIDSPGTPDQESNWQTHIGNTFILGYSREWVERSIVQLKKGAIEEPNGAPVLDISLPVAQMIKQSMKEDQADAEDLALMNALGLFEIKTLSSTIEFKETEMIAETQLGIVDSSKGAFSLLDTEPSELPTVTFIPDNIASLEVGRFNLLKLWQEIPVILETAQPGMKPQYDMILAMIQQQAGINFEQDLFNHLGTEYIGFSVTEGNQQTSIVALELEDGIAFKQGLETALAAPALQPYVAAALDLSDFLDHTIYTLKDANPAEAMGLALTGNYLLYGSPEGLRQVIRSQNSDAAANQSFEQTELVKGLRQHVKSNAFGFSAIDWKKNMAVIMKEITKPEYVRTIQQKWATSGSPLPPPDFNKLPPSDHISSFFNLSYQYVEATSEGLHHKLILKY